MITGVAVLDMRSDTEAAERWLKDIVDIVGPCFHVDTPPGEYSRHDGRRLLADSDCDRIEQGLEIAQKVLGCERFEDICLSAVWGALGVCYDPASDSLVALPL